MRENDRPSYKQASDLETELNKRYASHSAQDNELSRSGGKATVHLKARTHVPLNLLHFIFH
jgi:hypothetical protein